MPRRRPLDISFQEAGFVIKSVFSTNEKIQAYKLRHRIYCEELGWVPRSESLMEIDEYESQTAFIGVFDQTIHRRLCENGLPGAPFSDRKRNSRGL